MSEGFRWADLICAALLVLLAWLAPGGMIATIAILFVLFFQAHACGVRLLPSHGKFLTGVFGLLMLLAVQSVLQTAWYYAGGLLTGWSDLLTLAGAVVLTHIALTIGGKNTEYRIQNTEFVSDKPRSFLLPTSYLLLAILSTLLILRHAAAVATTDAIRTPWPLLPHWTVLALVLIVAISWLLAARCSLFAVVTTGLALLAVTLLTTIVYKLGFGFDGFLHRASEQVLLATGTLHPHPPYYLGQYVFVTWLSRLLSLPLHGVDVLLVPLAVVLVTLALAVAFPKNKRLWVVALLPVFLPLSLFITTTPQSFAYLLGLLAILTALADDAHPLLPLSLAAWSLATHPLAGLPFLGATLLIKTRRMPTGDAEAGTPRTRSESDESSIRGVPQRQDPWGLVLSTILVLLTAASVPLAFFFSRITGAAVHWNFSTLTDPSIYARAWQDFTARHIALSLWPDWAAFVERLTLPAAFAAAAVGIWKDQERRGAWLWLTLLAALTVVAALFLKSTGHFSFLIDYERGNYADRLLLVAQLLLVPAALSGLAAMIRRPTSYFLLPTSYFLFLFLAAWQGAQFYLALPRHDAAVIGHGWSVGQADLDAVRWIGRDADGKPYTVLANQSVSAAAVETFGFKRYATDPSTGAPIFYYPIPTGGPLYNVYLQAVTRHAAREMIGQAAQLGQSDRVYVVLNDYWSDVERTDETLTKIADAKTVLDDGKTTVYVFDFKNDKNVSR